MEFLRLDFVESRTKVHRIDEGYTYIPKRRDFAEYLKEKFKEIKDFGLGRLPTLAITLQEVGVLHTLVLFSPFGQI